MQAIIASIATPLTPPTPDNRLDFAEGSCLGLAREGVDLPLRILELRDKLVRDGLAVLPGKLAHIQYTALSEAQRLQIDAF